MFLFLTGRLKGQESDSDWILDGTGRVLIPVGEFDVSALPADPLVPGTLFEFVGTPRGESQNFEILEVLIPVVAFFLIDGSPRLIAISENPSSVPWIVKNHPKPAPV